LRVGILGGAFNPPHVGHLVCAQEAAAHFGLDRVELVPFREPPHRTLEVEPGAEVRFAMCVVAAEGDDLLAASRVEVDRPGPSYTVDTLRAWQAEAPDDELFLVMGGDQAASLPVWREPEEVLGLARVAVAERERSDRGRVHAAVDVLAGAERVEFFDMPRLDISSTLVRRRIAEGRPIRYLVPDAVRHLIEEHGLYRAATVAGA
jgi:nicotinate-nucleotide adenylyltransferase